MHFMDFSAGRDQTFRLYCLRLTPTLANAGTFVSMMRLLRLLPVILSYLLLGAHFYRAGLTALTTACIALLFLLFVPKPWVARLTQIVLVLGALEWLRALYYFAAMRSAFGEPWARLALILGAVALFTALSALVFQSRDLQQRYGVLRDRSS